MARRKKTSPAEDLMDLVAMLPWWAAAAAVNSTLAFRKDRQLPRRTQSNK